MVVLVDLATRLKDLDQFGGIHDQMYLLLDKVKATAVSRNSLIAGGHLLNGRGGQSGMFDFDTNSLSLKIED